MIQTEKSSLSSDAIVLQIYSRQELSRISLTPCSFLLQIMTKIVVFYRMILEKKFRPLIKQATMNSIFMALFLLFYPYIVILTFAQSKPGETLGRRVTGLKPSKDLAMPAEPPKEISLAAFFILVKRKIIGILNRISPLKNLPP